MAKTARLPGAVFLLIATSLGALYLWFPYFDGYGDQMRSVAHWLAYNSFHAGQGNWQHCLLVPFISAGLAWRLRPEWRALPPRPAPAGLNVLLSALFCYWFGYAADVEYFGYLSIYLVVAGLILWFWGWEAMRVLFFPWLFLVFSFPLPFLDNLIAFPLRLAMAQASHLLLDFFGLENVRNGTAILSAADSARGLGPGARFAIDIADPCSGIRSLFALFMISALYGYFALERGWRRGVLFALAMPLAIAGNIVRILLLAFATLLFGARFALGPEEEPSWFHMGAGYAVFAVALGGLIGIAGLLNRRRPAEAFRAPPLIRRETAPDP